MPPRKSKESGRRSKSNEETAKGNEDAISEQPGDEPMEDEDEEGGIRIGDIYLPPPPPPPCTFDNNGPRLVITHIENYFFKSYAGTQVLGPLHKNFTSIVGPNGSGKSNVIDSMLFVFGYRAQKIRSKKISVLIHNSDSHPNVQSCTVTVHFQKIIDKGFESFDIVPDSEFSVARTAFKDNSSFYQMNGKRCQFKAVAKLLRSNGIDLDHNRFLILQGEVEQIAMMKPKAQTEHDTGMLEYLEDIIGSSRFKEPIELFSKRVEELNEQRGEKLNRVKLVEKEKDELEEPKNEAVTHLKLENEVTRRQNVLFQRYILDCSKTRDEAELKKKEIDEGMTDIKNELAKMQEEKNAKEAELKEIQKKFENTTKTKEKYSENFKKLESEDVKLQEELKHKNQKRKKLVAQLKTDNEKLIELEKVPEKNENDIKECETLREEFEAKRKKEEESYHKAMASLNSETQQLQDEKEKLETKLIELRKSVDETKSALDIAQSELDIYLSTEKNEKKKLDQINESLEKASNILVTRKEEVQALKTNIPELESKVTDSQRGLQQLVPTLLDLEKELNSARIKLEESRSSMQSSRSRGKVLDAIMEQKRSGNIKGIFGRLGDLGGIDSKYDVAASTAIGPLDNVVVDNVETGQQCINFLKKNNIGTATFIALNKMERYRANTESSIQTPENVPRLFDLIKVKDDSVKTAFYYAIRDTLVATDVDQASRIAYSKQRPRVVTLNGELFEPSGTMSGGGRSVLRGRMGKSATVVNIDPQEVGRSENKVQELTAQVNQMRRQRADFEDCLQNSGRDLNTMKVNLKKYIMEIGAAEKQENSLKENLKEQKIKVKASESDAKKVAELEKNIGIKMKAYEKAADAAKGIEEQVNKIHSEIMEITGGKMKGMKKKLSDINKKLEKVNAEITRLQVATKTAKRNFKKTEEKIASMEAEIKEVESELLEYKERKKKIEEEAGEILDTIKSVTEEELELRESVKDIKESFDAASKKETEIKTRKIEFDQEIEKHEGIIKENKSKVSHWKKQMSKLELQDILMEKDDEEETELPKLEDNELQELDLKDLHYQLTVLQEKLAQSKPNLAVLQEYRKKEEVYLQRVSELEEITSKRDEQRKFHEDLRKQRLNEFMSGFTIISNKLKEMYQMITLGGDAELELVDSLDPFSEGIVFSVRPPKKSWKNITNLSGGEKTLSSLALVFALHYFKPTPLYVMDEIDAALDFKNVSIVGNYIKERTKNAQFIIISLRSQMFELADRLVGIYKTNNCTKSVTINPSKYSTKTAKTPNESENLNNLTKQVLVESK